MNRPSPSHYWVAFLNGSGVYAMAKSRGGALDRDLQIPFSGAGRGELGDGPLVDAFLDGREDESERAFEEVVNRHGPMVLRVCRQVLGDRDHADDAFQAVFLVLARSARKVRNRDSLGSWLHGVALRVATTARVRMLARRSRETPAEGECAFDERPGECDPKVTDRSADLEAVHQELARLPEHQRAAIVLCYLEGLTHDEAAARLRWPVGTVRSRLARGRDRLRGRLLRRGVTPTAVLGPLAAWLAGAGGTAAEAAGVAPSVSAATLATTVRTASLFARCEASEIALLRAGSFPLARGVLKTMAWQKLIRAGLCLIPAASMIAGGAVIVARTGQGPAAVRVVAAQDVGKAIGKSDDGKAEEAASGASEGTRKLDRTFSQPNPADLLEAARQRLEAQKAYYEEGRITLDRYVDASRAVMVAERILQEKGKSADRGPLLRHVQRLRDIEARERAELVAGRATVSDVAEIVQARVEAEIQLGNGDVSASQVQGEVTRLRARVDALEKKLDDALKALGERPAAGPGRADSVGR
ncbi:RNA polymerase sigma factor [Aquisphaera giovannonii]|uniref:RNA polymerase sigma factor n=1 Tax=Aquisphaera giovannonii TaxID=406548 RepID=UPI00143D825A|nr:RNA polymerase sigma factor [Aquisphaera giovannonii]